MRVDASTSARKTSSRGSLSSAAAGAIEQRLDSGLQTLGLVFSARQRQHLLDYLGLLLRWNAVYNLTSVRDPLDMVAVHLLDSLAVLPIVQSRAARRIVDVGTGAGLPGIPLAIALPEVRVQLVDAVAKKVSFLRHVAAALPLPNIAPMHRRIEALTLLEKPDLIVSRAFADISKMVASASGVVDGSTTVLAMKGAVPHTEIEGIAPPWRIVEVHRVDVPFLGAERCAVILQRDA